MKILTTLATALVAAALAGCLDAAGADLAGNETADAEGDAPASGAADASPAAGGGVAAAAGDAATAAGPRVLYLTADGGFSEAPPTSETRITLPTPVNSPFTGEYPEWQGRLPWPAELADDATLVVYVSASTASLAANTVVAFQAGPFALSDFFIDVSVGSASWELGVEGPDVLVAGEVVELRVPLPGAARLLDAGADVAFSAVPTYVHVAGAAEFQYVIGPDAAARIELSP